MILIEDILLDEQEESEKQHTLEFDDEKINGLIIQYLYEMMQGKISESSKSEMIDTLIYAYENGYRHSYYNISNAIYQNISDENMSGETLELLANNIQKIKDDALGRKSEKKDSYKGINKFYDHVMLEITRINDHALSMQHLNEKIKEFGEESERGIKKNRTETWRRIMRHSNRLNELMTSKIDSTMGEMEKFRDNIYSQLVAILGIFAAIIVVFFGGASVFAKVLEKLGNIDWIEAAPVLAITGFVMFNMVFMFLFVISRMIDKDIGTRVDEKSKCVRIKIILWIMRYPYMFLFNIFMIIIFISGIYISEHRVEDNITYQIYENSTENKENCNIQ